MERLGQLVRQDEKYANSTTLEVHAAIIENYEDQFGDLLQRHSMMPEEDSTPSNPELEVDLKHLDAEAAKELLAIKDKNPKLYKHYVGEFTGWSAVADINCRKKAVREVPTSIC